MTTETDVGTITDQTLWLDALFDDELKCTTCDNPAFWLFCHGDKKHPCCRICKINSEIERHRIILEDHGVGQCVDCEASINVEETYFLPI